MTKIFEYLSKGHQMTSMGLLIGMAASRRGTMDAGVAKLLSIHLQALTPLPIFFCVPFSFLFSSLLFVGLTPLCAWYH
jgi:hypothetical protein